MSAMASPEILRYAAFADDPSGGNPAGVVLDASGLDDSAMQAIAAQVGYSETAFVTAGDEPGSLDVRYFSPQAEVPFCGHATIATGVAWAARHGAGDLRLATRAGLVALEVVGTPPVATLTSVAPSSQAPAQQDLTEALAALRWRPDELDPALPPRVAYAGAHHLVLAAATSERLADLDYDFDRLGALMAERDWTTVALVHRCAPDRFSARNPFPPGGVVEDPATGAAAAALGGYLRELGLVAPPARITIEQGADIGRPSLLTVEIPTGEKSGVRVSGTAVAIPEAA
jgi:PhzF family phenazine biosynthesis protein